jgi:hypothetical protein
LSAGRQSQPGQNLVPEAEEALIEALRPS